MIQTSAYASNLIWFTGDSCFDCIGCLCSSCLKLEFSVGLCLSLNWHLRASGAGSSEGVTRPCHPVRSLWSFQAAFSCLAWAQQCFSQGFPSCCKLCRSQLGKGGLVMGWVRSQGHREASEAGEQRQLLQLLNRKLLVINHFNHPGRNVGCEGSARPWTSSFNVAVNSQ